MLTGDARRIADIIVELTMPGQRAIEYGEAMSRIPHRRQSGRVPTAVSACAAAAGDMAAAIGRRLLAFLDLIPGVTAPFQKLCVEFLDIGVGQFGVAALRDEGFEIRK